MPFCRVILPFHKVVFASLEDEAHPEGGLLLKEPINLLYTGGLFHLNVGLVH